MTTRNTTIGIEITFDILEECSHMRATQTAPEEITYEFDILSAEIDGKRLSPQDIDMLTDSDILYSAIEKALEYDRARGEI